MNKHLKANKSYTQADHKFLTENNENVENMYNNSKRMQTHENPLTETAK